MSKSITKKPNCKCITCEKGLYEPPSVLKRRKKFFCSNECKLIYGNKKEDFECENCKKIFSRYPSENKKSKRYFCSKNCNYEYKNKEKYNEFSSMVDEDFKKWLYEQYHMNKMSTTEVSRILFGDEGKAYTVYGWMKRLDIPIRSISEAMTGELNNRYGITGEEHPNYDFSISDEERVIKRNYREYNEFRNRVYERDNYTCQVCSDDSGGNLVCHHLNGYHWDKRGRTEPDNGVTLCETCHNKFHSIYGKTNNNLFQFSQFKESYQLIK